MIKKEDENRSPIENKEAFIKKNQQEYLMNKYLSPLYQSYVQKEREEFKIPEQELEEFPKNHMDYE